MADILTHPHCDQLALASIEEALSPSVDQYLPSGSPQQALIHQWVHALAFDFDLFAQNRGITKSDLKKTLRSKGLYTNKVDFFTQTKNSIHLKAAKTSNFKFIDLFAGIGGMRQGFEAAGGQCVFSSEFEPNAQNTYFANYGEFPFGDIKQIDASDIPDHDILVAGFPCQPFSHAGRKLGIEDTRGTLFHDIARILECKKPRAALLENVRGLVSHDGGYTLAVILDTLHRIGYRSIISNELVSGNASLKLKDAARQMILSSKDFGVPQNRQRIYIVLWREDLNVEFKYPAPPRKPTKVGDILEKRPDKKYTISDRLWSGHQRRKTDNKIKGKGFGYGLVTPKSEYTNTISARYYKDGSEILVAQPGKNPRKLTPREAARIQGFPDEFIINPSDVQAYKQFGNSVSVPVVQAVASEIYTQILSINIR